MANTSDQARTTTAGEILDRSKSPSRAKQGGLAGLAASMGNDELMARLEQGNLSRDEMLEFLVQRLGTMRDAQLAEIDMTNRVDNTFRTTLGDSATHAEPSPRRWAEAANLYEQAARALCGGQLHKGHQLLESATKAEEQAFQDVKELSQFDDRLKNGEGDRTSPDISANIACTECEVPEGVDIADDIQRVSIEGHQSIKGQRRELDPWWTDLEEEEEEEEASA